MKLAALAARTAKEIVRDPLNICFGLGFPVVLLLLLSAIQANIPVALFQIERLAPGVAVFGLSFISLFSAMLIARDRESTLLQRLYTAPLAAWHFILGYALPLLPVALLQGVVCFAVAALLGLQLTAGVLLALAALLPVALLFIALGLLFGSVLSSRQAGGICGALLTNLTAWLSGIWFDIGLVGGAFEKAANLLPFKHAVELERAAVSGALGGAGVHIAFVAGYAVVLMAAAVLLFLRRAERR